MTQNQIAYQKAQEEARRNRAQEAIEHGKYSDEYGYDIGKRPYKLSRYQTTGIHSVLGKLFGIPGKIKDEAGNLVSKGLKYIK